jgi:hypothetical protein
VVGVMIHVFLLCLHAFHGLDFIDMHLVVLMIMHVQVLKFILVVVTALVSILSYYLVAFMHVLVLPIPFDHTMDLVLMCYHLHLWFLRVVLHGLFWWLWYLVVYQRLKFFINFFIFLLILYIFNGSYMNWGDAFMYIASLFQYKLSSLLNLMKAFLISFLIIS